MKVFYLSSSAFCDNQISLLHHFSKEYELTYGVIFPERNSNYTDEEIAEYCTEHDIDYVPFHLKYRFRDPRNFASYYKIVSLIKASNPDVIFVANFDQLYLNILLLLLDRKKTIIAMHDVENHSNTAFSKLATLAKTILLKNFTHFLTYSKHQSEILNANYKGKNVYTIPLPLIGFGDAIAVPKKEEFTKFLFFGNILYYKGLDILLKAVSRLSLRYPNFKLVIAGRCNDWAETYEPLIEDYSKIEAHIGFIENEDIPGYFADADYLVLPYRDTTQSGPLMIAYNYNTPIIASNAEGFKEFFQDGRTGYSYDQDIPEDIDRILGEAIERSNSEYAAIKAAQAEYADQYFSVKHLSRAYQHMFDGVANRKLFAVRS